MLGRSDPPLPTGDLAYRIILDENQIQDPELRSMMTDPGCRVYAGPKAHCMMYSLKGGKQMNIVLLVPDDLPVEVSRQAASTDEMMTLFSGWDPVLKKFLRLVQKVDKWRLMHREDFNIFRTSSEELNSFSFVKKMADLSLGIILPVDWS